MELMTRKVFGIRLIALLETIFLLFLLLAIDQIFGSSNRFLNVHPHPFWIVILLVSAQYGTPEGIIAVVLSTLLLYAGNVPPQPIGQSLFDYQVQLAILPVGWLIAAFILGQINRRLTGRTEGLEQQLTHSRKESETITAAYGDLKKSKETLEIHLAGERKTAVAIFNAFKVLETLKPTELIFKMDQVVKIALNPIKFSIYEAGLEGFEVAVAHGWTDTDNYLSRYPAQHPLAKCMLETPRIVCVINKDDESIIKDQGLIAGPLFDLTTGKLFGMLKIEAMDPLGLTLSNLEIFKSVCELVSLKYTNALRFSEMQRNNSDTPSPYVRPSA